jgi:cytochrome c-type biogenesis protein CcmH/NrfF
VKRAANRSIVLLLSIITAALGEAADVELTKERRARIERLENSVLAPCCYTEPVSRHSSEISVKMRVEIQNWVVAGKTDEEILGAYEARYGSRVLVPAVRKPWWTAGIPWLLLAMGGSIIVWLLARWRARTFATAEQSSSVALPPVPESEEDWTGIEAPDSSKAAGNV